MTTSGTSALRCAGGASSIEGATVAGNRGAARLTGQTRGDCSGVCFVCSSPHSLCQTPKPRRGQGVAAFRIRKWPAQRLNPTPAKVSRGRLRGSGKKRRPRWPDLRAVTFIALAGFAALMGVVLLVDHPAPIALPPRTEPGCRDASLPLAFLLVLPLALSSGPASPIGSRWGQRPGSRPSPGCSPGLRRGDPPGQALRFLPRGGGSGPSRWPGCLVAGGPRHPAPLTAAPLAGLLRLAARGTPIWTLTGALLLGVLLCLTFLAR